MPRGWWWACAGLLMGCSAAGIHQRTGLGGCEEPLESVCGGYGNVCTCELVCQSDADCPADMSCVLLPPPDGVANICSE